MSRIIHTLHVAAPVVWLGACSYDGRPARGKSDEALWRNSTVFGWTNRIQSVPTLKDNRLWIDVQSR